MNWSIHYKVFKNPQRISKNCLKFNETYCVPDKFGTFDYNLALETLRQMCLLEADKTNFVNYMKFVREGCFNEKRKPVNDFKLCLQSNFEKNVKQNI